MPSSLFQQFGQWSDTKAEKQDQYLFHSVSASHGSFYKQIRVFFVILVQVFETPLYAKVVLLVYVFGLMRWKLLTFTRGSHTFTLTQGEISSECVTKRVIGRTSAEYDEESDISIKWIGALDCALVQSRIFCVFLAYIVNSFSWVLQKRFLYDLGVDLCS